jgi:hypothetical protein
MIAEYWPVMAAKAAEQTPLERFGEILDHPSSLITNPIYDIGSTIALGFGNGIVEVASTLAWVAMQTLVVIAPAAIIVCGLGYIFQFPASGKWLRTIMFVTLICKFILIVG